MPDLYAHELCNTSHQPALTLALALIPTLLLSFTLTLILVFTRALTHNCGSLEARLALKVPD